MQKLLIALSVLLVLFFGGRALVNYMSRTANEGAAVTRVERMLKGLSAGGNFQDAFNMWIVGDPSGIQNLTQDEYNSRLNELHAWLREGGLRKRVDAFSGCKGRLLKAGDGLASAQVVVSCTVDGVDVRILAVDNTELTWAE